MKNFINNSCKHTNTVLSSYPSIWYICQDCGAWLDNRFEIISKEKHKKIMKYITGKEPDDSYYEEFDKK